MTFYHQLARQLEADARDALDLVGIVDLRIDGALLAVAEVGDGLGLAEIDAAGELAQNDDVEPFDRLALGARGVGEKRVTDRRPDIGKQTKVLAQAKETRFRPHLVGHVVPFRPADGAKMTASAAWAFAMVSSVMATAVGVVRGAADQPLLGCESGDARFGQEAEQTLDLGHHFRADAVAREKKELVGGHDLRLTMNGGDC